MQYQKIIFLLSVAFLLYFSGVAAARFDVWPASMLLKKIEEAQGYLQAKQDQQIQSQLLSYDVEHEIASARAIWQQGKAFDGYTLITARYSQTVFLLDMDGKVVWHWDAAFRRAWPNPSHIVRPVPDRRIYLEKAALYPNGDILVTYTGIGDTPYGYGLAKFDKHSNLLWTYDERVHHDIFIDQESGNIYTLTHQFIRSPIHGLEGLSYPLLADYIVTLTPDGKEINRISILEAFRDSPFSLMLFRKPKNQALWDITHTNAVIKLDEELAEKFPLFKAGDLMISSRSMNAIAVIDPVSKSVRWANDGLWKAQHSPKFTQSGGILLLDNKGHIENNKPYSRIIEINPNNLHIKWSYLGNARNNFYTDVYGRVQQLPNGNVLVAASQMNKIFELSPNKEIVWEFTLPLSSPHQQRINVRKNSNHIKCFDICPDEFSDVGYQFQGLIIDAARYSKEELSFMKQAQPEKASP